MTDVFGGWYVMFRSIWLHRCTSSLTAFPSADQVICIGRCWHYTLPSVHLSINPISWCTSIDPPNLLFIPRIESSASADVNATFTSTRAPLPRLPRLFFPPRIHSSASAADVNATFTPQLVHLSISSPYSFSFRGSTCRHQRTSVAFSWWAYNIYLNQPHSGLLLSWVAPIPHRRLSYHTLDHCIAHIALQCSVYFLLSIYWITVT